MTSRAMHLVVVAALAIAALLCVSLIGVSSVFTSHPHALRPAAPVVSSELPVLGPAAPMSHAMGAAPLG